jgi:predicted nucleotidyltransferase
LTTRFQKIPTLKNIPPVSFVVSDLFTIFADENYKTMDRYMSTQAMTEQIANYFKTQPVLKAWLFGSFARGEETELSDVDILVVLDDSQHIGLKFFGMYEDLKALLGRNVDLVTARSLAPYARKSVDHDKILIYERAS